MHAILFSVIMAGIVFLKKDIVANMRMKKAFSDLWIHPGRTLLVIFALVIGLWGVGSIIISYSILKNDLNENFTRTIPAHAVMTSDNFNRLDLTEFRNRPEIEKAEFRDFVMERIEVYPGKWLSLWLYGVEDFNNFHLAGIYQQEGNKIPEPGTILMERDGQNPRVSNLKIGSKPRLRIGSKIITVPITGISFDPAQAPATQDAFIYAYTDKNTYSQISGKASNQRLIFRLKNLKSKQQVQEISKNIINDFKQKGITVKTLDTPKFNEHPHQFQLNTLLMINGLIGLLAFFMGAVLVSQLMGAVLSQQIRQIGILKAIGASRIQVIGIYLAMVMILGAVSSMVAIPLAVLSGYGYAGFVAKTLNFEILTRSLPVSLYIYLIASGFILPVLLSLPAILKGVKVSVYEAITDHGISQNGASGIIKESLFLPFPNSMRLAFRNTLRRKKRLAITIVTMALGVAIFSTGFNVRQSLSVFLADSRDAMKHDVQLVFKDQIPLQKALAPFQTLGNLKRIESWNGGKGRLQTGIVSTSGGIGIIALPWNTDLMTWKILEGRWLKPSENIEMVMNQQAAEAFGNPTGTSHDSTSAKGIWPEVGRTYSIHIKGKEINATLVGIIKEFDIAKIYLDQKQYDLAVNPDHLINSLMFVAGDNTYKKVLDLKKDIENAIASSDLNILYVMSQAERAQIIYDHLNIILTILAFLALLVLVVSALGMASATSINIMERTREIGVLRAIGATPKMIYSLFVTEGMFVSIVSILLGLLLAWPMSIAASLFFGYLILGSNTPLDFAFSYSGFVITLLITFAFGWLASRIPARKAVKVSTREALSYE